MPTERVWSLSMPSNTPGAAVARAGWIRRLIRSCFRTLKKRPATALSCQFGRLMPGTIPGTLRNEGQSPPMNGPQGDGINAYVGRP